MPVNSKLLIIGGGAAAVYFFRTQIEAALGISSAPAPAITAATTAAATATAAGATPAQAASIAASVIANTPPAPIAPQSLSQQLQARAAAAGFTPSQQAQFTAWQWNFFTNTGTDITGTNGDLGPVAAFVGWDEATLERPGMTADTFAAAVAAYRTSKG